LASLWARASILLQDNAGNIAKVVVLVAAAAIDPSGGAIAALRTAIVAVTKALSPRAESGTQAGAAGEDTAGDGAYSAIEDRAVLTFRGDDNSTYNYEVPCPKPDIFLTGTDTVDPGNAAVVAYYQWIEDNCVGTFGQELTFVRGERTRKKQMKH